MLNNDLAWGNAGNLSARTDADHYIVTAGGTRLGELAEEDLVEVPLHPPTGHVHVRKPSKEMPMHAAIYEARPEINAVLHASPFFSTLIACSDVKLPGDLFVEDMYYLERIARALWGWAMLSRNRRAKPIFCSIITACWSTICPSARRWWACTPSNSYAAWSSRQRAPASHSKRCRHRPSATFCSTQAMARRERCTNHKARYRSR
jgi:hypothetical protein